MRRYVLSRSAESDLIQIFKYTVEKWGSEQLEVYRQQINIALRTICIDPNAPLSKPRDDLVKNCRLIKAGHHVIAYRIANNEIQVARILHERMHIEQQISPKVFTPFQP